MCDAWLGDWRGEVVGNRGGELVGEPVRLGDGDSVGVSNGGTVHILQCVEQATAASGRPRLRNRKAQPLAIASHWPG